MIITLEPRDDFDAALEMVKPGDVIRLQPGRHTTRGNWAHRNYGTTFSGIRLEGVRAETGEVPILALQDPVTSWLGVERPDRDLNILWLGNECSVSDLHLDCSCPSHPDWCVGGIRFYGKFRLADCIITSLRGTAGKFEVFGVSSWGNTGGSQVIRVAVQDVKPSSYVSGIFLGGTVKTRETSTVQSCWVDLGSGNWFCYAANFSTVVTECSGQGAEAWFHNDFGETENVVLRGGSGTANEAVIRLVTTQDGIRQLAAFDMKVEAPRGLVLWQKGGHMTGHVVIQKSLVGTKWVACCVSPECHATFIDCTLSQDSECQYRNGTEPPQFIAMPLPRFTKTLA